MAQAAGQNYHHKRSIPKKKTYGYTYHIRPDTQVPQPNQQNSALNEGRELYRPTPTKTRPSIASQAPLPTGTIKAISGPFSDKTSVSLISGPDVKPTNRPYIYSPKFDQSANAPHVDSGGSEQSLASGEVLDDGRSPLPSWGVRLQKFTYNAMGSDTPTTTARLRAVEGIEIDKASGPAKSDLSADTALPEPTPSHTSIQKTPRTMSVEPSNPSQATVQQAEPPPQRLPPNFWDPPTDEEIARVPTPPGIRVKYSMRGRQKDKAGKPRPLNYKNSKIGVPDGPSLAEKRHDYQHYDTTTKGRQWRSLVGKQIPKPDPTPTIDVTPAPVPSQLTPVAEENTPADSVHPSVKTHVTPTPEKTKTPTPGAKTASTKTQSLPMTDPSGIDILHLSQPPSQKTIKGVQGTSHPWIMSMFYENEVPFASDHMGRPQRAVTDDSPHGVQPQMIIEDEVSFETNTISVIYYIYIYIYTYIYSFPAMLNFIAYISLYSIGNPKCLKKRSPQTPP